MVAAGPSLSRARGLVALMVLAVPCRSWLGAAGLPHRRPAVVERRAASATLGKPHTMMAATTIGGHAVVRREAAIAGGDPIWAYATRLGVPPAEGCVSHDVLAAQIWPASRVVAFEIDAIVRAAEAGRGDDRRVGSTGGVTMCELGSGSGLISLAAAKVGCVDVIATDVDQLSPSLIATAAAEQGLAGAISTRYLDLTASAGGGDPLPSADVFVMADVFVTDTVAFGAAARAWEALERGSMVVVAAQGDRSCRGSFLDRLRDSAPAWAQAEGPVRTALEGGWGVPQYASTGPLVLRDVDEADVAYF